MGYDYDENLCNLPTSCQIQVVYMKSDLVDSEMKLDQANNFFSIQNPKKIQLFIAKLADILWFGFDVPDHNFIDLSVESLHPSEN